jgi:uncharacterized protein
MKGEDAVKRFATLLCCFLLVSAVACPAGAYDGTDISSIRQLAQQGDPEAQTKLGVLYSVGIGVGADKQKAAEWYGKAAAQGFPRGEWNLAFLYVRGEGVARDYSKALALFRKAADQGLSAAQYDLGMMYLQGLGVPPQPAAAESWLRKAVAQGSREAGAVLAELRAAQ